jgi:hypothetical protein
VRNVEYGGLGGTVCQRGTGRVQRAHPQAQGFEINQRCNARSAMRVQLNRYPGRRADDRGNQRAHAIDREQAALVLDINGVGLERQQLTRLLRVVSSVCRGEIV